MLASLLYAVYSCMLNPIGVALFFYLMIYIHQFLLHYTLSLICAILLSVFVFMLTSYHMKLVYSIFRLQLSFKQALLAQALTSLGNMFWIPVIGGLMGQKKVLPHIPPAVMSAIHIFERILVASMGVVCAFVGAWHIWGHALWQHIPFMWDSANVLAAIIIIGLLVFRSEIIIAIRTFLTWRFLSLLTITGFVWLLSTLIFVCFFLPEYALDELLSHSIIVSFLSSLPITWNGWGVREASSALIFKHMDIPVTNSISVAVACGLVSMLVAIAMSLILRKSALKSSVRKVTNYVMPFREKSFITALGTACAFLIFFQVYIKSDVFTLNVNVADPLAMCGLFLYGLHLWQNRHDNTSWSPLFFIIITTTSLILSALWGMAQFGGSWWGCINKAIGLWVVWGYFGLGMTVARHHNDLSPFLNIMKRVIVCIIAYHFVFLIANQGINSVNILRADLSGFAMNRNAFAMQILCVIIALASKTTSYRSLVVMNVALYFTYSRTAAVLTPIIYASLWWFGAMQKHRLLKVLYLSVACVVGMNLINPFTQLIASALSSSTSESLTLFPTFYSDAYSDSERLYTIVQGLSMWLSHPWIGAGLGAFVQNEWLQHQRYLMIHNSYVWILAEMGIVGAAIWGAFSCWIVRAGTLLSTPNRRVVLGICFVLLATAMVHEILYQRIFWWMLGLFMGTQPECLKLPEKLNNLLSKIIPTHPSKNC